MSPFTPCTNLPSSITLNVAGCRIEATFNVIELKFAMQSNC